VVCWGLQLQRCRVLFVWLNVAIELAIECAFSLTGTHWQVRADGSSKPSSEALLDSKQRFASIVRQK
jgi:hypothetical protein